MVGDRIHTLKAWRLTQQLKLDACAAGVGTVRQVWYDWEGGRRVPSPRFMIAIYRFTAGEIRPDDFYELPDLVTPELPLNPAPAPLFDRVQATAVHGDLQAAA